MNPAGKVTIPPHVMARQVGNETVILDLETGTYFGLDPVGARIWQLISEGKSLTGVCDALLIEFDVGREQLEGDIERLTGELRARGLLSAPDHG